MREYERLIAVLDEVLDAGGADENSHLAVFAERIGEVIQAYAAEHHPVPDAEPAEVLRLLNLAVVGKGNRACCRFPCQIAESFCRAPVRHSRRWRRRRLRSQRRTMGI